MGSKMTLGAGHYGGPSPCRRQAGPPSCLGGLVMNEGAEQHLERERWDKRTAQMSNTPDGSGARPLSPHHLCATTHSSVLKIVAHRSGRKWLASSSSSVEQTGEVVKAKRGARRRHWQCAAIWRLWSKNDITWRLGKYNKRRRRRTLVVCCRLTDHLRRT